MWWHEAETTSAADAHYTHPTKDGELQPPGFLCLSMLSCSKLFIRALSYLASFDFHRFSFEKNCIVLFARFSKIPAIKACYQNRNFFFFFFTSAFYNTFISSGLFFCYVSEYKIHCSTGSKSHLCEEHICSIPVYCFHHLHPCYRGTSGYYYNYKRCRFYSQCRIGL